MAKKMWGGRFKKEINPLLERFSRSIQYDHKLAQYDIFGSIVHVRILKSAGYLTPSEARKLTNALDSLYKRVISGKFKYDHNAEDIHTDIQNKLLDDVGELALKLHMARSRNDQVVFAMKAYCKTALAKLMVSVAKLMKTLDALSSRSGDFILPGFTHMQHAQPVYLRDYLEAYRRMFGRDFGRFEAISKGIKLTMGSGALAGTPIAANMYDQHICALSIEPPDNSLDTVSNRDFVIEILNALSITGMHMSRFSEDLIIWSTREFGYIEIDESFCTGSSLMPHKKNVDSLELIRGCAGRLYGNLMNVLTMMKGLPLTYNRDMQCDKEPLFSSVELTLDALRIMTGVVSTMKFNKVKIEDQLEDESLYAADLVYYLVDEGVPFKTAHTIVGKLVRYSLDNEIEIKSMSQAELEKFSTKFNREEILKLFNPKKSAESKRSIKRR